MLRAVEDEFARAAELAPKMQLIFPAPNGETELIMAPSAPPCSYHPVY
jgi:hypothetical protein